MAKPGWLTQHTPLIIGHRGASADAPENTLAAFALALQQGADGLELDVQLSADGQPVVFHDSSLQRLSGRDELCADLPLSELQAVEVGTEETIPSLHELFEMLGPQTLYNVELKSFGLQNNGLVEAVAEVVESHGLTAQVLISSFNPLYVRRAREVFPASTLVALLRQPGWQQYAYLIADGEADHPHHTLVDESYMSWAGGRGYRIHVWTVDDPAEANRLAKLGVHGIITNKPGWLRRRLTPVEAS